MESFVIIIREINGLAEAMRIFSLKEGYIITMDEKETVQVDADSVNSCQCHCRIDVNNSVKSGR